MSEPRPSRQLAALIERFVAEGANPVHDARWLQTMRDGERCEGLCRMLATGFALWLIERGWRAHEVRVPLDDYYADRTRRGLQTHHVTRVLDADGTPVYVDWTAAQYGYEDFPLVQRQAGDGSWQRQRPIPRPRLGALDAPTPAAPIADPADPHRSSRC